MYQYTDSNFTENAIRNAIADAAKAYASGYDPDTYSSIISNHYYIRNEINELALISTNRTIEAENLQRLKLLENDREEKEEKENRQREMAADIIQDAQDREKWLCEEHDFGGLRLAGKEITHVTKYARENRARIQEDLHEDGISYERSNGWFDAMKIMEQGGPKNNAEKEVVNRANADQEFNASFREWTVESGIEPKSIPDAKNTTAVKPESAPEQARQMSF